MIIGVKVAEFSRQTRVILLAAEEGIRSVEIRVLSGPSVGRMTGEPVQREEVSGGKKSLYTSVPIFQYDRVRLLSYSKLGRRVAAGSSTILFVERLAAASNLPAFNSSEKSIWKAAPDPPSPIA